MNNVRRMPIAVGAVGTAVVWLLLILFFSFCSIFMRPQRFKTIHIQLDSARTVSRENAPFAPENAPQPSSAEKNPAPEQMSESRSAADSSVPETVQKSVQKAEPARTAPSNPPAKAPKSPPQKEVPQSPTDSARSAPPKQVQQVLQKSVDELLAEQQTAKRTETREFDWSQFDDVAGVSSENFGGQVLPRTEQPRVDALRGEAGTAAEHSSAAEAVSRSGRDARGTDGQQASGRTASALQNIGESQFSSGSVVGVSSEVTLKTGAASDGAVSMEMADGSQRILLEPSKPVITLSPAAAALIDSQKKLTVSFTVAAAGTVSVSSVRISPDILPSLVSSEVRAQVARWRFEAASADSRAEFKYTIQKN